MRGMAAGAAARKRTRDLIGDGNVCQNFVEVLRSPYLIFPLRQARKTGAEQPLFPPKGHARGLRAKQPISTQEFCDLYATHASTMEIIGSTSIMETIQPGILLKQPIQFKSKDLAERVDLCFSVEPLILPRIGEHPRIVRYVTLIAINVILVL